MERVQVLDWIVEVDRDATSRVHDILPSGSPEACGCGDCLNFIAGRSLAYPAEALALYSLLGIRPDRESEIGGAIDLENGRYHYSGFHHCVGRILAGPTQLTEYKTLVPGFQMAVHERRDLAAREYEDLPLVQVEFVVELPWLLADRPPE